MNAFEAWLKTIRTDPTDDLDQWLDSIVINHRFWSSLTPNYQRLQFMTTPWYRPRRPRLLAGLGVVLHGRVRNESDG
jgi:hypothetical protein